MKTILFALFVLFNLTAYAKPTVAVSILPEKTFVEKIAKDRVDVMVMVKAGNSPHTYEPKPSQMMALSKAKLYFSIGVEFEDAWLDRFQSQNPHLKIVNISSGISKLTMLEEHHTEMDPHTWTAPQNVAIMANDIYKELSAIDPKNQKYYQSNLKAFMKEIKDTDMQIKDVFKNIKPKTKFMVFHPSWGYFAKEYNLVQVAIEVEGKKPKPKAMIQIIKEAKKENIKVIFTQPEFSDKSAQIIAKEANVRVIKISPLNANWSQNLIEMAEAIANKQ